MQWWMHAEFGLCGIRCVPRTQDQPAERLVNRARERNARRAPGSKNALLSRGRKLRKPNRTTVKQEPADPAAYDGKRGCKVVRHMLRGPMETILYEVSESGNVAASLEQVRQDCPGQFRQCGTLRAIH